MQDVVGMNRPSHDTSEHEPVLPLPRCQTLNVNGQTRSDCRFGQSELGSFAHTPLRSGSCALLVFDAHCNPSTCRRRSLGRARRYEEWLEVTSRQYLNSTYWIGGFRIETGSEAVLF